MDLAPYLRSFGESLKPREDVEKQGNLVLDEVLKRIQERSKAKIVRVVKAGSVGKRTALQLKIDFDCVFFLQPGSDPDRFLDDVEDILTLRFEGLSGVHKTSRSIGFFFKGFYFDFLPAVLQDAAAGQMSGERFVKDALRRASQSELDSAELVEGSVLFMNEQSGFTHTLARLMKFWSHSLLIPGFFNGRSLTMELLAVSALEDVRDEGRENMLRGFRLALDRVKNYQRLHVVFERFYRREEVPTEILAAKPLLLDPSNPQNNLLSPDRLPFFNKLAGFAEETLRRLDVAERAAGAGLDALFQPQPDVWLGIPQRPKKLSWIVGYRDKAEVQQPTCLQQSGGVHPGSLQLITHLLALCVTWQQTQHPSADAMKIVEKAIDTVIVGENLPWTPTNEDFASKNAVAVIPLFSGGGRCVLAGFDVEGNPHKVEEGSFDAMSSRWPGHRPGGGAKRRRA